MGDDNGNGEQVVDKRISLSDKEKHIFSTWCEANSVLLLKDLKKGAELASAFAVDQKFSHTNIAVGYLRNFLTRMGLRKKNERRPAAAKGPRTRGAITRTEYLAIFRELEAQRQLLEKCARALGIVVYPDSEALKKEFEFPVT